MHEKRPQHRSNRAVTRTVRINGRDIPYTGSQNPKAIALWIRERRHRTTADIRDKMQSDIAARERELGRAAPRTSSHKYSPQPDGWFLDCQ